MSKVSSTDYPSYSSSSVSIGDSSAKTGVTNGVLSSSYDMSGNEGAIYDYALSTLASILPKLNTFDTDTLSSIQSEVNAYKNQGLDTINETYNPMITNLENDIASRFGNLDNSIFKDDLSDIESERADAVSSFAQNVLAKQSELKSDELTKRYALVELLNGLANDTYSNALNTISTALGSSASANSYNSGLYKALSDIAGTNSSASTTSSLLSNLLGLSGNSSYSSLLNLL
ncbi:MAG: hypothetical protein WCY19_04240 [Candidatus Gastranaerophilaceae bacterium]